MSWTDNWTDNFVHHSCDYKPNGTPRSPFTVICMIFCQCFYFLSPIAEWRQVGCYINADRALDVLLRNLKVRANIQTKYADCVAKAEDEGATVFGMDDKRCWTGSGSFNKHGDSGQCKKAKGSDLQIGFSDHETMFVYKKDDSGNN